MNKVFQLYALLRDKNGLSMLKIKSLYEQSVPKVLTHDIITIKYQLTKVANVLEYSLKFCY